jgi:mRNA interferase MazF
MLKPGDVVELDLEMPAGSEAGLRRPAVVVTAGRVLRGVVLGVIRAAK